MPLAPFSADATRLAERLGVLAALLLALLGVHVEAAGSMPGASYALPAQDFLLLTYSLLLLLGWVSLRGRVQTLATRHESGAIPPTRVLPCSLESVGVHWIATRKEPWTRKDAPLGDAARANKLDALAFKLLGALYAACAWHMFGGWKRRYSAWWWE